MSHAITIEGARTHNLKNVNLVLPGHKLIVFTGVSGSGKSSLAFDTIYAEGRRRYVESLSAYARQFLEMMDKPDVDAIDGLSPAISIEQKSTSHNPRSTVGTVTEVYDYLRLLFARLGDAYCPEHGSSLIGKTVDRILDEVMRIPDDVMVWIEAPLVKNRKGEFSDLFKKYRQLQFGSVEVDGVESSLADPPSLVRTMNHDILLVIDKLRCKESNRTRMGMSLELAIRHGAGRCVVKEATGVVHEFSTVHGCPECDFMIQELEPRLFSFNNPVGACPACDGLGFKSVVDLRKVLDEEWMSLRDGVVRIWDYDQRKRDKEIIDALAEHCGFYVDEPWAVLSDEVRNVVLHGSGNVGIKVVAERRGRRIEKVEPWPGVVKIIETQFLERVHRRFGGMDADRFMTRTICPECDGDRINLEARNVRVCGLTLPQMCRMPLDRLYERIVGMTFKGGRSEIARHIVKEIADRLRFLNDVGLDYLNLARGADTLSGGEAQRIRLASQIGSGLSGVLYVLDEPSIGLHQRDNDRLVETLTRLRDLGNTVIVVEHDEQMIRSADHVVDFGPGAGEMGGSIVVSGTPDEVRDSPESLTGMYLAKTRTISIPDVRTPPPGPDKWLVLKGCRGNNLRNVDFSVPAGLVTCVTGVSGSGKSTLVNDTLAAACLNELNGASNVVAEHDSIEGIDNFDKVVVVDQSPIGRTPRSNPATYTKVFDVVRDLFASLPTARQRGYDRSRFSFNLEGGRCEECGGDGLRKVEMHFLSDIYVTCEGCDGKRYNRETLEVTYRGKSIADVLAMTVDQALEFFSAQPTLKSKLSILADVGLGYIRLGQSSTTLSGGEAQRVKLSLELAKRSTGRTLYILDEPTTGLHFEDVNKLLEVIGKLKSKGNTIVIIEHNLDVIKTADWIVDLGPEGGQGGGSVIALGTPERVAQTEGSHTGRFLKEILDSEFENASA